MSTDPVGNTATYLNRMGVASSAGLNDVSALLGAVADVAGTIGAVSAVISIFTGNGTIDQLQAEIEQISTEIQNDYHQLQQDLGAQQILNRNSAIWDDVSPAYAWLQLLNDSINAQPPLEPSAYLNQIHDCVTALDKLSNPLQPDQIWNLDYDWEVFWTDAGSFQTLTAPVWSDGEAQYLWYPADVGYGPQAPPPNSDGSTVFTYVYSLPTYLLAITCLISVAGALDPSFPSTPSYTSILSQAATVLQNKHDTVVSGIKILSPGPWTLSILTVLSISGGQVILSDPNTGQDLTYSGIGIRAVPPGTPFYWDNGTLTLDTSSGGIIEYGAVETFSGRSIIESSYAVTPVDPSNSDPGPYNKLQLRALNKAKQLYQAIGLPAVRNTINQLLNLAGKPQLAPLSYGDWSFRNDVIPTLGVTADPTKKGYSVRDIMLSIAQWPPPDTPAPPFVTLSVRQMLTGSDFPDLPTDL